MSDFDRDIATCEAYHKAPPEEQALIRELWAQHLNDTVPACSAR